MYILKLLYILLGIISIMPLYACGQHIEDYYEDYFSTPDSINRIYNPSDTSGITDRSNSVSDKSFFSDTIKVAHWNIGNFALGNASYTSITADETKEKAKLYHEFLDTLDVDVIGICEYDPTFSKGGEKAKDVVFENFPYYYIGKKYSYNCNAVFCKKELKKCKDILFTYRVQTRYYVKTVISINGIDILLIESHLDWDQGSNGSYYRKKQITELIETLKDTPYVILCADFNISKIDEYKPFIDAGFKLANGDAFGLHKTYPASNPESPIDNIIFKGFNMVNITATGISTLSDHLLIKSDLVIIR